MVDSLLKPLTVMGSSEQCVAQALVDVHHKASEDILAGDVVREGRDDGLEQPSIHTNDVSRLRAPVVPKDLTNLDFSCKFHAHLGGHASEHPLGG